MNKPKNGNKKVHLGTPYIEDMPDGKMRLCAELTIGEKVQILYFEVDGQWGQYLVTERSDAFILGIFERALKNSWDIYFEQPMSEDLYYNLTTYAIPVYARNIKMFQEIKLHGKTTAEPLPTEDKAGTGFSCGVDSFYTVLKHLDNADCPNHNVTHLLLAINGAASTGISEELDREWLENSRKKFLPYARELGMELICMGGNIDLFYVDDRCFNGDITTTASFVYALQKLFGIYYWASAYPAEIFHFDKKDGGYFENVAVPYVSTRGLRFYHSGSEVNRVGKIAFISDNNLAQRGLPPCGELEAVNCGRCVKCLRTMAELFAAGKLEAFREAFPVDDYLKHFRRRLAKELAIDHPPFTTDILDALKEKGIKIPVTVYAAACFFYKPMEFLRVRLREKRWARRILYFFNLDAILLGKRQSDEERAKKLNGTIKIK